MKKFVDASYPDCSDDIAVAKISVEYVQELDCCQSSQEYPDDCQIITFTSDDGGGGKFIRFKTGEAGWSIDDIDELITLVNDFKQRLKCE